MCATTPLCSLYTHITQTHCHSSLLLLPSSPHLTLFKTQFTPPHTFSHKHPHTFSHASQTIVVTLIRSIPMMVDVLVLALFFLCIFGVTTVQLYAGQLAGRCGAPDFSNAWTDTATGIMHVGGGGRGGWLMVKHGWARVEAPERTCSVLHGWDG